MKLVRLLTPTFILLFLCGCATPIEFVRKNPKKQAVVRHVLPSITDSKVDYKAELNEQATNFCDGEYKIKNAYQTISDASTPTNIDTAASTISLSNSDNRLATYEYVELVCK